jgi:hypothetical protein
MSHNEIEQIEVSIEEARKVVAKRDRVIKLIENEDFNAVIHEWYFKDEVIRLANMASDPVIDEKYRECVNRDIHGPASLRRFLSTIIAMGNAAENEIANHEEEIENIREEEGMIETFGGEETEE